GKAHQLGEAMQMARRQTVLRILDLVQVLDEQRALVWAGPDQLTDGLDLLLAQHAAFREQRRLAPAGPGMVGATLAVAAARPRVAHIVHVSSPKLAALSCPPDPPAARSKHRLAATRPS